MIDILEKSTLDAAYIVDPYTIRYLTGFMPSVSERDAYLLCTNSGLHLLTTPLSYDIASHALSSQDIHLHVFKSKETLSDLFRTLATEKSTKTNAIGYDSKHMTAHEYHEIIKLFPKATFQPIDNFLDTYRAIKTAEEIRKLSKAAKLTTTCFETIVGALKPGVKEKEIAWKIETYFRTHNAFCSFSPIVAFGKNSSIPHYDMHANATLSKNDTVLLDMGARVDDYCADMTRMVTIGTPLATWQAAYNVLNTTYTIVLSSLQNGERSGATLDVSARETLKSHGFDEYPHSLGHGVGLEIHEYPRLTKTVDMKLLSGMVVTVEPGIYIPKQFGMRLEDTIHITPDGINVLTTTSRDVVHL